MVIRRGVFLSLFGEIHMRQLFPKFNVRHEGFSFYGPRKSDWGADTDVIYTFCWPKTGIGMTAWFCFLGYIYGYGPSHLFKKVKTDFDYDIAMK